MKSVIGLVIIIGICSGSPFAQANNGVANEQVLQIDRGFLQSLTNANKTTTAEFLDDDFTFTDSTGKTLANAGYLQGLNGSASIEDAAPKERVYGAVAVIMTSHGRTQIGRIWVKRKAGWRLLTYDETTLIEHAEPIASSGVSECENPCKALPYTPRNEAEQGVITSWQALETAVTHHDSAGWGPHIADEFLLINANNDHPLTKSDRMAILDKQKQTGAGAAPVPLVSAKMFDFGDTVVMTARHQRGNSKPIHVTRVWIKRDGQWMMAFSQQTTIQ
jgi:hypothetical protein